MRSFLLMMAALAVVNERYRLIRYLGYDGYKDQYELYDLVDDPKKPQLVPIEWLDRNSTPT